MVHLPARSARLGLLCAGVLAAIILWTQTGSAHKPITSRYTYNEDVFPIFRDRCGRCHVTDGVGPMSLLTYNEAFPWAESVRAELLAEELPLWHTSASALSAREVDVMLEWSTGGTPQGSAAKRPPPVTLKNEWPLGPPDEALQMPAEFQLAADKMEETQDTVLPTGLAQARWIRAVDLLPGTPAIVRDAIIYLRSTGKGVRGRGSASNEPDAAPGIILTTWTPGLDAAPPLASGRVVQLPARAELLLRVHYKKTWKYEGTAMTDRSTVGLYFTDPPKRTTARPR